MHTHLIQNPSSLFFSAAISSSEQFWLLFWAVIGGLFVFIGLVLEKVAECKSGGIHVNKKLENFGWCMLMGGILIEIADAGFAANEGWEIKQMADPKKAKINDMAGTAVFLIKGVNFNPLTNWDSRWVARMTPCENTIALLNVPGLATSAIFDTLDAEKFVLDEGSLVLGRDISAATPCGIRFNSYNFRSLKGFETAAKEIDNVNLIRFDINFLPSGTEIMGGSVNLVVNDSIRKKFIIFPQSDTNSGHGTVGQPYVIIATNFDLNAHNDYLRATNEPVLRHYKTD